MKSGFRVFIAVFIALGGSWCGFVLAPELQLGTARQTTVLNSSDIYPIQRSGDAALGLQVYRANGCVACHTTQIRQDGVTCEVVLTSFGANRDAVFKAFSDSLSSPGVMIPVKPEIKHRVAYKKGEWPGTLPSAILSEVDKESADIVSDKITSAGGKVETHIVATGPDIARGWGVRRSVAADYLWDHPVQLGSLRAGPDLANVGARLSNANWQLLHLYAPQSVVKNSAMPPFRFLFEVRKIGDAPSTDALNLSQDFAPPAGYEVVPKPEAKRLAAYLLSLRADVPLYEAPFTPVITAKP